MPGELRLPVGRVGSARTQTWPSRLRSRSAWCSTFHYGKPKASCVPWLPYSKSISRSPTTRHCPGDRRSSVPSASASLKQIVRSTCSSIPQVSGFTLDTLESRLKEGFGGNSTWRSMQTPAKSLPQTCPTVFESVARPEGEEPEHPVDAKARVGRLLAVLSSSDCE